MSSSNNNNNNNNNINNKASAKLREEENKDDESKRQQQGACSSDYVQSTSPSKCSICYERIINVPSTSSSPEKLNNKCQKCLTTMNAIPSGFPFKFAGDTDKEFECPICLSIIREATELPTCHHVMCRECLVYYEQERQRFALEDEK